MELFPGALPQAVTFRAFGAETQSFHTPSIATGSSLTLNEVFIQPDPVATGFRF
jgi:hypothetical protein